MFISLKLNLDISYRTSITKMDFNINTCQYQWKVVVSTTKV